MNKEQLVELFDNVLDKAFIEYTKEYWLNEAEVINIKAEVYKAISAYLQEKLLEENV